MNNRIIQLFFIFFLISHVALGGTSRNDWRKNQYFASKKGNTTVQAQKFTPNKIIYFNFDFNNKRHRLLFGLICLQIIIPPAQAVLQQTSFPQNAQNSHLDLNENNGLRNETEHLPALISQGLQTAMECADTPYSEACTSDYHASLPFLREPTRIGDLYKNLERLANGGFHLVFKATPRQPRSEQNGEAIAVSIERVSVGTKNMPPHLRLQGLLTKNRKKSAGADRFLVKALGVYLGPVIKEVERLMIPVSREAIKNFRGNGEYRLSPNDTHFFDLSRTNNFPRGLDFGEISPEVELIPVAPNDYNAASLPLLYLEYELLSGTVRSDFPSMLSLEQQKFLLEFFIIEKLFAKIGLDLRDPHDNQVGLRQVHTVRLYLFDGKYYLFTSGIMPVFLDADFFRIQCDPEAKFLADAIVHDGYLASILRRLKLSLEIGNLWQWEITSKKAEELIAQGVEFHNIDNTHCGVLPQLSWDSYR
jgi:hypothetical protein